MIDVHHQVNAVRRTVGHRTLEAGEARVVTLSQTFPTDADDAWDAVTNAERIPRWFLPISGELRVGGRYQLEGNAGGTIERCDPPKSFAATWEFGDATTWIEVTVAPEPDGGATVTLEHIAHVDDETWTQFGPGAVGIGWDLGFMGLERHLATGQAIAQEMETEYLATDEGRDFARQSGEAWRAADVASGTDEAEARERGDRTIEAYTAAPPPEEG